MWSQSLSTEPRILIERPQFEQKSLSTISIALFMTFKPHFDHFLLVPFWPRIDFAAFEPKELVYRTSMVYFGYMSGIFFGNRVIYVQLASQIRNFSTIRPETPELLTKTYFWAPHFGHPKKPGWGDCEAICKKGSPLI